MALPVREPKAPKPSRSIAPNAGAGVGDGDGDGADADAATLRLPRRPRYSSREINEMAKALQAIDPDLELRQEEGPAYSEEPLDNTNKRPRRCLLTPRQVYEMTKAQLQAMDADLDFRDDDDDPPSFDIGRRPIYCRDEFGEIVLDYVPLTRADALHPREGDEFVANQWHNFTLALLMQIACAKLGGDPGFWWMMDGDLDLGLAGCRSIRPDLAFLLGVVRQRDRHSGKFYMEREANPDFRAMLAIEVTSESTRQNDLLHKKCLYADAGFEQYVIVDWRPATKTKPRRVELQDCRLAAHVLMEQQPRRASGRVPLAGLGVWLGVVEDDIAVYESERGKRIHDYSGMVQAWEQEKRKVERANRRIERERQRAERASSQAAELTKRLQEAEAELRRLRGEPA